MVYMLTFGVYGWDPCYHIYHTWIRHGLYQTWMAKPTHITGWAHVGYKKVYSHGRFTPPFNQLMGVHEGSPTAMFAIRHAHKYKPMVMTNIAMV